MNSGGHPRLRTMGTFDRYYDTDGIRRSLWGVSYTREDGMKVRWICLAKDEREALIKAVCDDRLGIMHIGPGRPLLNVPDFDITMYEDEDEDEALPDPEGENR